MSKLQAHKEYKPVQYDYVTELPQGWQLLPNIAIFQERIERGFVDEELLSVTIGSGVIKRTDVDIEKDSSRCFFVCFSIIYMKTSVTIRQILTP